MGWNFGTGPVFVCESIIGARRWQIYGARACFVALLLLCLMSFTLRQPTQPILYASQLAQIGREFFEILSFTQITLILLAAPASTAGSICLDRARGTLTHLLVTDLSSGEIVLGKFAAKLLPTLALIVAGLPVLMMSALLGGIDFEALAGLFLISLGLAFLGCSLALLLSVWAGKTHEVLLAIFSLWAVWLLGPILIDEAVRSLRFGNTFEILGAINPYVLANRPYSMPLQFRLWHDLVFLTVCFSLSALFLGIAIGKIRHVSARVKREARPRRASTLFAWLPSPSLDTNPVLWREWNMARPSRWARVVGRILSSFYALLIIILFYQVAKDYRIPQWRPGEFGPLLNGFAIAVGLLMLAVNSATSLAEERTRGSLDVLLTTPLSTRSIVLAKWLGVFLRGSKLAIAPTLVIAVMLTTYQGSSVTLVLMPGLILAYAAVVTSIGLLMATLTPRLGRAVAWTVAFYAMIAVGGYIVPFVVLRPIHNDFAIRMACGSPFVGVAMTTFIAMDQNESLRSLGPAVIVIWFVIYVVLAGALLLMNVIIFDRRLGRVNDRRPPKPQSVSRLNVEPKV